MVKSCIAMARATNAHNCEPSLTPFEALAALFWTRISKVKGTKSSLVDMYLCLDVRKVLGLENGCFGNCMVYKRVQGDGLEENKVSKAAENVDLYSAVFEENSRPLRVSYYIEPAVGAGQILVLPSPGGDGQCSRVVSVTLPQVEAEKLLEDGLIMQFGPTIWMGLK
ncbi:hypothetical protein Salat_0744300 [Sesamum alatum]|uniref:Uncharacterized protein n=1 Tax=Sesamum alatum TaxID=300844 RepID=A0AAE1YU75_9LAMI|nr:hypothetical protein Salat_0744300 [Sesamum alatum]